MKVLCGKKTSGLLTFQQGLFLIFHREWTPGGFGGGLHHWQQRHHGRNCGNGKFYGELTLISSLIQGGHRVHIMDHWSINDHFAYEQNATTWQNAKFKISNFYRDFKREFTDFFAKEAVKYAIKKWFIKFGTKPNHPPTFGTFPK